MKTPTVLVVAALLLGTILLQPAQAADPECRERNVVRAVNNAVVSEDVQCLSDAYVAAMASVGEATWRYEATPQSACTILSWAMYGSLQWVAAPCYSEAQQQAMSPAPSDCRTLGYSPTATLDLCGNLVAQPDTSLVSFQDIKNRLQNLPDPCAIQPEAGDYEAYMPRQLDAIAVPCHELDPDTYLNDLQRILVELCPNSREAGLDSCVSELGPLQQTLDDTIDTLVGLADPDEAADLLLGSIAQVVAMCPGLVRTNPVGACGVSVPSPCPNPVQSNPTRVCGVSVPDPCPTGVQSNPTRVCGANVPTPCPNPVQSGPTRVCGVVVPDPCPTGVQSNPTRACGVSVPDPTPTIIGLANALLESILETCDPLFYNGAESTQVCGVGVDYPDTNELLDDAVALAFVIIDLALESNPCPQLAESGPQGQVSACGVPLVDPEGLDLLIEQLTAVVDEFYRDHYPCPPSQEGDLDLEGDPVVCTYPIPVSDAFEALQQANQAIDDAVAMATACSIPTPTPTPVPSPCIDDELPCTTWPCTGCDPTTGLPGLIGSECEPGECPPGTEQLCAACPDPTTCTPCENGCDIDLCAFEATEPLCEPPCLDPGCLPAICPEGAEGCLASCLDSMNFGPCMPVNVCGDLIAPLNLWEQPCDAPEPGDLPVGVPVGVPIGCLVPYQCVTITFNGQEQTVPVGMPAVFLDPATPLCPPIDGIVCPDGTGVLAVAWFTGAPVLVPGDEPPCEAALSTPCCEQAPCLEIVGIAGTFEVVPNPFYASIDSAAVTMGGATIEVKLPGYSKPAALNAYLVATPTVAPGGVLASDAEQGSIEANVALTVAGAPNTWLSATFGGRQFSLMEGAVQGFFSYGWNAKFNYEYGEQSDGASVQTLSFDWRSLHSRPLYLGIEGPGPDVGLLMQDMPTNVNGAQVTVSELPDAKTYSVHWPANSSMDLLTGHIGDFPVKITTPPESFDFTAKVSRVKEDGVDWNHVDATLNGVRGDATTDRRTGLDLQIKDVHLDLERLSDNVNFHFSQEDTASNEVAGLLLGAGVDTETSVLPRFRLNVVDPKLTYSDLTGSVAGSILVTKPDAFHIEVTNLRSATIDSTEAANVPGSSAYDVVFGRNGLVLLDAYVNKHASPEFYQYTLGGACTRLNGHLLLTKTKSSIDNGYGWTNEETTTRGDIAFAGHPLSCSSETSTAVSFELTKNGEQALYFDSLVEATVAFNFTKHRSINQESGLVNGEWKKKHVEAFAAMNEGDFSFDLHALSNEDSKTELEIRAAQLSQLAYRGELNKGDGIADVIDQRLAWAIKQDDGAFDLHYDVIGAELNIHVDAGSSSDVISFDPGAGFSELCWPVNFALDRDGAAEHRCWGLTVFCTIGPNTPQACANKQSDALMMRFL